MPGNSAIARDHLLDGFRGIAACGVVFSHALSYRFAASDIPALHLLGRFTGPIAEISVQIFFVISGYIITTLLIKEENNSGRPNLAAFYARRICRIMPPFLVFVAAVWLLDRAEWLHLDRNSALQALTFTCNTNLPECNWWVAHSWSLAVEEQFYLAWPVLFILLSPRWRPHFLTMVIAVLLCIFIAQPLTFHANAISFTCIATGALLASYPRLVGFVQDSSTLILWLLAAALLVIAPFTPMAGIVAVATPFLVTYLVFAARRITFVSAILTSRPILILGSLSYSLYLWQQLFFAKPDLYLQAPISPVLLPPIVVASVFLVEKPFINLGHRWSRTLKRRRASLAANSEPLGHPETLA